MKIDGHRCTLTLVTPVITGGLDRRTPEVRWQAIRGNIRRWHRVIDPDQRHESRIFGSTADRRETDGGGQGVWLLRPRSPTVVPSKLHADRLRPKYFTWAAKDRGYVDADSPSGPFRVSFDIVFKPGMAEADKTRVLDALWLWSLVGGLGARTRRGFGSMSLSVVPLQERPGEGYPAPLLRMAAWRSDVLERLATLSRRYDVRFRARMVVGQPSESWSSALETVATAMSEYRRALPRAAVDRGTAPATTRFGLPVSVAHRTFTGDGVDRSASPIWVRVARLDGRYRPYLVYWPAPFLPPGAHVRSTGIEGLEVPGDEVLAGFLSALTDRGWEEVAMPHE